MSEITKPCPVCGLPLKAPETATSDSMWLQCWNCGDHRLSQKAVQMLDKEHFFLPYEKARIAFRLRAIESGTRIDREAIRAWADETTLPGPMERVDRLLMHLANRPDPMEPFKLVAGHVQAAIGAATRDQAKWVIDAAIAANYLQGDSATAWTEDVGFILSNATLTLPGWERHQELTRQAVDSRHAFMAMAFSDDALWTVFQDHMQPAVKATGFDLMTTADARVKKAGNIIARMKVEIHTSRFMVCDLTHGNQGAYWEAGFAEGLGRPVIYTCRADVMADPDPKNRPHFDTAQQLIVKWDQANPGPGMQELKDVIRATLPAEAKMTDN